MRSSQRLEVAVLAGLGLMSAAPEARAAVTNPIAPGSIQIGLTRVATMPVGDNGADAVVAAPGDSSRLFVLGRTGQVRLIKNGILQATPFLTMGAGGAGLSVLNDPLSVSDERGLLGIAFHPGYATPASPGFRKFYTYTSETKVGNADFSHPEIGSAGGVHQNLIREWTVSMGNADVASTTSRVVMRIAHPQSNHNGGAVAFGLDNHLYIALGDGGGSNDGDPPGSGTDGHTNTIGNGQDLTNVFGKILRIDPVGTGSTNTQYGIPGTNPFSGAGQVREIYAYGLRNPFRIGFDRVTGKLYTGDVGQGQREEIDEIVSGGNYGWPYLEGSIDNPTYSTPGGFTSISPIGEYTHSDGRAVIGGFVYNGTLIPQLVGKYVFGEYIKGTAPADLRGRLFYMDLSDGIIREFLLDSAGVQLTPSANGGPGRLFSLGEGATGELYATFSSGDVLAIVPEPGGLAFIALAGAMLGRRRK